MIEMCWWLYAHYFNTMCRYLYRNQITSIENGAFSGLTSLTDLLVVFGGWMMAAAAAAGSGMRGCDGLDEAGGDIDEQGRVQVW